MARTDSSGTIFKLFKQCPRRNRTSGVVERTISSAAAVAAVGTCVISVLRSGPFFKRSSNTALVPLASSPAALHASRSSVNFIVSFLTSRAQTPIQFLASTQRVGPCRNRYKWAFLSFFLLHSIQTVGLLLLLVLLFRDDCWIQCDEEPSVLAP